MFGCGPLRQFADNRQNIRFVVAGFHHHENRNAQQQSFQHGIDPAEMIGQRPRNRPDYPRVHQPQGKQVQALKGVETHHVISPEFPRREHDHRRDPADGRNVAKNRCGPGRQARQWIRRGTHGTACRKPGRGSSRGPVARPRIAARLPRAATGAVEVGAARLVAALGAEWHSYKRVRYANGLCSCKSAGILML